MIDDYMHIVLPIAESLWENYKNSDSGSQAFLNLRLRTCMGVILTL